MIKKASIVKEKQTTKKFENVIEEMAKRFSMTFTY